MISFLFILALGLSILSVFIAKHSHSTSLRDANHRPDAFMEDVVAIIINKQGNPSLRIESPKMVHYADNDTTDITTPHLMLYRQSPEPWHINSNYAKATQGLTEVFFWNHVVIHHLQDVANPTTDMTTSTLTVFPDQQIAKTDDTITVVQPNTTIHGVGMLANLNDGTVQLFSQARGEYVPGAS
ncbi:MAG: lptC [Gammaproteobacteria bacterium]|jgi:lipopolysaccharide export system protein LptC|nr:lptC [Gammaproteobacteria bacterium]